MEEDDCGTMPYDPPKPLAIGADGIDWSEAVEEVAEEEGEEEEEEGVSEELGKNELQPIECMAAEVE